jgi:hypothetical protein
MLARLDRHSQTIGNLKISHKMDVAGDGRSDDGVKRNNQGDVESGLLHLLCHTQDRDSTKRVTNQDN